IKQVYDQRGVNVGAKFIWVQENFRAQIAYTDLTPAVLNEYFSSMGVSNPVNSLKDEVERVKKNLPGEIDAAAKKTVDDANAAKVENKAAYQRDLARKILFPLAQEGWQVTVLDRKIRSTADDKLDELLLDAAKRRMLFDIP